MKLTGRGMETEGVETGGDKFRLLLFVAGNEPNSQQARENLTHLCEGHLQGRYELDVIDVFKDFGTALEEGVLVTPALIRVAPLPRVTVLGSLSDTQRVLDALRLSGVE
jgi:circadian clock protein KaiB